MNVTEPTESPLLEQGEETWDVGSREDLDVGDTVGPFDAQDAAEAAQVERVESPFLSGVEGPCLATVQQGAE